MCAKGCVLGVRAHALFWKHAGQPPFSMSPNTEYTPNKSTARFPICVSEQHTESHCGHWLGVAPVYGWGSVSPMLALAGRGTHEEPSREGGPPPAQHKGPVGSDALQGCGGGSCVKEQEARAGLHRSERRRGRNSGSAAQRGEREGAI